MGVKVTQRNQEGVKFALAGLVEVVGGREAGQEGRAGHGGRAGRQGRGQGRDAGCWVQPHHLSLVSGSDGTPM